MHTMRRWAELIHRSLSLPMPHDTLCHTGKHRAHGQLRRMSYAILHSTRNICRVFHVCMQSRVQRDQHRDLLGMRRMPRRSELILEQQHMRLVRIRQVHPRRLGELYPVQHTRPRPHWRLAIHCHGRGHRGHVWRVRVPGEHSGNLRPLLSKPDPDHTALQPALPSRNVFRWLRSGGQWNVCELCERMSQRTIQHWVWRGQQRHVPPVHPRRCPM